MAPSTPLLYVLRNDLSLNGPKFGCGLGECGACMVLVDGRAARACVLPAAAVEGHQVTTLEGLADGDRLDPVQQAFIDEQGAQCGYCLNGMIMSVRALLNARPAPSRDELVEALDHNLCRCGTHQEILAAACRAAGLTGGRRMSRLPEQRERDEALAHGLVIRPPVYRLDARAFVCSQLLDVNRDGLDEDVTVVADGNFLGVVAASPEQARRAAERLRPRWSTPPATTGATPRRRPPIACNGITTGPAAWAGAWSRTG